MLQQMLQRSEPRQRSHGTPGGSTGLLGSFCGLDRHRFQVHCCHFLPARVSDGTCFCTNTGDPGEQKVPGKARGQVTDSEHQGPTASGSLNWAEVPANEKPLPSLGRSLSHKPHLEHCHKRSGKCLWLGLSPGCPWLRLTSAAGKDQGKE